MAGINVSLINLASRNYYVRPLGPLSVRILGGYLRAKSAAPVNVSIMDMQDTLDSPEYKTITNHDTRYNRALFDMSARLTSEKPDIVGLSMKWETKEAAAHFIRTAKAIRPTPLILAGNSIATFGGRQLLEDPDFAGICIVEGEGEEALRKIVERASGLPDIGNPDNYSGIANVRTSPEGDIQKQALDLSSYPILTQDNAPELFLDDWGLGLEFSRGCSWHRCTFCSIGGLYQNLGSHHQWRPFSKDLMMDRMERFIRLSRDSFWARYGYDNGFTFWANDSEFLGSMADCEIDETIERAEDIAKGIMALRKRYGDISMSHFSARVDTIFKDGEDEKNKRRIELFQTLKEAGFKKVYLGIESGSPTQLRRTYAKGVTVEENREAMRLLRDVIGMQYEVGFIFFSPEDTMQVLRDNWSFIDQTGLDKNGSRIFSTLRPQAGSQLTKRLIRNGYASPDIHLDTVSHPIIGYKNNAVKNVAELFELWESQSIDLVRYLNSTLSWKGRNANSSVIRGFIDRIRTLDKLFLKKCIDMDGERFDAGYFSSDFLAIIKDLREALSNGQIEDSENGMLRCLLDESTEKNKELTRQLNP